MKLVVTCDECGKAVEKPHKLARFQGRLPSLCGDCLTLVVRGVAQVDRAVRSSA